MERGKGKQMGKEDMGDVTSSHHDVSALHVHVNCRNGMNIMWTQLRIQRGKEGGGAAAPYLPQIFFQ